MTDLRIIYSPRYEMGLFGIEQFLHPFDTRRATRVWKKLRRTFGPWLHKHTIHPTEPISHEDLLLVHSAEYLQQLGAAEVIARAIEVPWLASWPRWLLDWALVTPMRWITAGTVVAAQTALETGAAIHLAGGFHHAKPNRGEGFCLFADVAIAVAWLRTMGQLAEDDRVLYIDLDAHQGNGVCHCFHEDLRVFVFDLFCREIYPWFDTEAERRIDSPHPLPKQCSDQRYLDELSGHLPNFVKSLSKQAKLVIYNAGMDILAGDPVGQMAVSREGILARDKFVFGILRDHNLPVVMLPSGGYTRESAGVFASSVTTLLTRYGRSSLPPAGGKTL